jgi:hypothetical protein
MLQEFLRTFESSFIDHPKLRGWREKTVDFHQIIFMQKAFVKRVSSSSFQLQFWRAFSVAHFEVKFK